MAKAKSQPGDIEALSTLALAKSIVEGDADAARVALNAGANAEAFWIDGCTSLRDFAKTRRPVSISRAIEKFFAPEVLKSIPSMNKDPSWWRSSFVEFVAMRGYNFQGRTNTLSRLGGSELKGLNTAKAGVKLITKSWRLIEDASCRNADDGKTSHWTLSFRADWKGDRRIVGFQVNFKVDATAWEILEMFRELKASGRASDWPDPTDRLLNSQKDWEGWLIVSNLIYYGIDVDELVACLRKGGSPFAKFDGKFIGEFEGTPETKAFMNAMREAIGDREGWHLRVAPLLTDSGVNALREKAALKLLIPKSKNSKRSLKDRSDVL